MRALLSFGPAWTLVQIFAGEASKQRSTFNLHGVAFNEAHAALRSRDL
ncbi:hypothetical protein [Paenibacillus terrigena]|nr:hypothetical protein [Paenibacillus terrigena]